jgi:hypothetical protein
MQYEDTHIVVGGYMPYEETYRVVGIYESGGIGMGVDRASGARL